MVKKNNNDGDKYQENRKTVMPDLNMLFASEEDDHLVDRGLDHHNDVRAEQPLPSPLLLDLRPAPVESQVLSVMANTDHSISNGRNDNKTLAVRATTNKQRRNPTQNPKGPGKTNTVPVPYPWGTNSRAKVQDMASLKASNINYITGELECRSCLAKYEVRHNLVEKFNEVAMAMKNENMYDRAPPAWKNPTLPTCERCGVENSAKPVISEKKREINWLFLFLSQLIGCCKHVELKYFCKHCHIHRTGAKDRLIYQTYLQLCKQLDPDMIL